MTQLDAGAGELGLGAPSSADHPVGYPDGYCGRLTLADGRWVDVRPVLPSDGPALARAVQSADPDDVRRRFLLRTQYLDASSLERLAWVDYVAHFRVLALSPAGDVVGVATYRSVPTDALPSTVDVGVAVAVGWRRVGLAAELLWMLAVRARECGFHRATALADRDNLGALALARRAGSWIVGTDDLALATGSLDEAERRLRSL